jgi:general stress protein YciG
MADNTSNKGGQRGGTHAQHVEAGRKGGEAVSKDREHMAEIVRQGGEARGDNEDDDRCGRSGGTHTGGGGHTSGQRGGTHEQHVKAGEQSHKNTR